MNRMSPAAIANLGNAILNAAMEQTAKDIGIRAKDIPYVMKSDKSTANRVKDYIDAAYNNATVKAGSV